MAIAAQWAKIPSMPYKVLKQTLFDSSLLQQSTKHLHVNLTCTENDNTKTVSGAFMP